MVGAGGVGGAAAAVARTRPSSSGWCSATSTLLGPSTWSPASTTRGSRRRGSMRRTRRQSARLRVPRGPTRSSTRATRGSTRRSSQAAFEAGCTYLDMAMTLSEPPSRAALRAAGRDARRRAVRGGRTLGGGGPARARRDRRRARVSRTSSRATPPTSSSRRSTRWAFATARISSSTGYDFAPTFSIWTTIEECLNPPLIWERERGWFTTEPFSEPEVFDFPEGIGPIECVNVEHEEVVLVPALGRVPPCHVQVRPRRGVHRRAARRCTSSGSTRRCRSTCAA